MRKLELALDGITNLEATLDSPDPEDLKDYMENKANYKTNRKAKSLSLDEVIEFVVSEFLNMLGIDHSPFHLSSESELESPRERLLRKFKKDILADGCSLFDPTLFRSGRMDMHICISYYSYLALKILL